MHLGQGCCGSDLELSSVCGTSPYCAGLFFKNPLGLSGPASSALMSVVYKRILVGVFLLFSVFEVDILKLYFSNMIIRSEWIFSCVLYPFLLLSCLSYILLYIKFLNKS